MRIIILAFFIYIFYTNNSHTNEINDSLQDEDMNISDLFINNPNDKYVNPTKYDQPLPLINRSATKAEIDWATRYLRMPTWSFGYNKCDSEFSEVSCYELHHAAKTIERWENSVKTKTTVGTVFVDVNNSLISFADKLSMLYHGLQISIVTNRELVTFRESFDPIILPNIIRNPNPGEKQGNLLSTDHSFACSDVSNRFPNIYFKGAAFPQVLYTHPVIAPKLREDFGFHAAHLMGNYLFGQIEKPSSNCAFDSSQTVIEGWAFAEDNEIMRPHDYSKYLSRCGVISNLSSMVTNEIHENLNADQENEFKNKYKSVFKFNQSNIAETTCAFRRIISAKKIVQTFGSRFGFWATVLQGSKGSFVNGIDKICTNLTNSQQGSLWHTYCPFNKRGYLYRSNTHFFLCGNNLNDAKLFIDYLLW